MKTFWRRVMLRAALAAALVTGACGGDDSPPGSGDGELAGPWRRTAVGTTDTCDIGGLGITMDGILQVTHVGPSVTAAYQDICRQLFPVQASGSVAGSVVMVSAALPRICRDEPMIGTCCYDAVQTDTGTLQGDSVVGETIIAVALAAAASDPLCPASFTCEVRGSLEWERCPPADCSFQTCVSPAP